MSRYSSALEAHMARRRHLFIGAISVAAVGFVGFLLWLFLPHAATGQVRTISWAYTIHLRERTVTNSEGWAESVPWPSTSLELPREPGAWNVRCTWTFRRMQSYDCHCTTNSDGFTDCDTCQRAIYDDYCRYIHYTWPVIQTKRTGAVDTHEVFWPDLMAKGSLQRCDRLEKYLVRLESVEEGSQDFWDYEPAAYEDYFRFQLRDPWALKVNHAGMVWPQRLLTAEAP